MTSVSSIGWLCFWLLIVALAAEIYLAAMLHKDIREIRDDRRKRNEYICEKKKMLGVPPRRHWLHHFVMRLRLFLALVWREWEPKSCCIPDEYRIHYRLTVRDAWSIASSVWAHNDPNSATGAGK